MDYARAGHRCAMERALALTGHGAREVVAAPSPHGWRLFEALGFENVPVVPDVCFYWTS